MAISSVSAASGAVQQQQKVAVAKEPQQAPAERPRESGEATVASAPQPPVQQVAQPQRAEAPKPVVNAQGQKTGTIINTAA
jgi:hypothetical protein